MLHPLPPQLLKFVQFRSHSQEVVCVKLHIFGGKEDFILRPHTYPLCQAVPEPENNLTHSFWTEQSQNHPCFPCIPCSTRNARSKVAVPLVFLPSAVLPAPLAGTCSAAASALPGGAWGTWALLLLPEQLQSRTCLQQTHSPAGDRWLKQELRNI